MTYHLLKQFYAKTSLHPHTGLLVHIFMCFWLPILSTLFGTIISVCNLTHADGMVHGGGLKRPIRAYVWPNWAPPLREYGHSMVVLISS